MPPLDDLVTAYEALRAAVVARPPVIVAELGVLRGGVRAWMAVCHTPSPGHTGAPPRAPAAELSVEARQRELVAIWAQMAATISAEVAHG